MTSPPPALAATGPDHAPIHATSTLSPEVLETAFDFIRSKLLGGPTALGGPRTHEDLKRAVGGPTVTPDGIGAGRALALFRDVLLPSCIANDHPRYLSFVPTAPCPTAKLFDCVLSAATLFGGSWLESSGLVFAEQEALECVARHAGMPPSANGTFVSGGTAGNLSALIAARWWWRHRASPKGSRDRVRGAILCSGFAHSSVESAARAMDVDIISVPGDERGKLVGTVLEDAILDIGPEDLHRIFAIVVTSGTTNCGIVDDLKSLFARFVWTQTAKACARHGWWMHVDGAYGGAGIFAPSVRKLYKGLAHADSFTVDPHKWLFGCFDCCALIYRDPTIARMAHTQHAPYLSVVEKLHPGVDVDDGSDSDAEETDIGLPAATPFTPGFHTYGSDRLRVTPTGDPVEATCEALDGVHWHGLPSDPDPPTAFPNTGLPYNPSDFAHHLTRRARGMPFWYALASHGSRGISEAVEATLTTTRAAADLIRSRDFLQLVMEPELSVVMFRRKGWSAEEYHTWSDRELEKGEAFVVPTTWGDETVLRLCFVNPKTTVEDVEVILRSLEKLE